jgi:hypothetical protein
MLSLKRKQNEDILYLRFPLDILGLCLEQCFQTGMQEIRIQTDIFCYSESSRIRTQDVLKSFNKCLNVLVKPGSIFRENS